MSQRMNRFNKLIIFLLSLLIFLFENGLIWGQNHGAIWVKSFKPGSANLNDPTIDKKALVFVDSLMLRNDIEVAFLGGSDQLLWKQTNKVEEISKAWDNAKRLERASKLRERYGRGEIGTTDEPIRGIKVVWSPRKPDPFQMNDRIGRLEDLTDSLRMALFSLNAETEKEIEALEDSLNNDIKMTSIAEISTSNFAWEVKSGFFVWSSGKPYDLAVPYVGIALKRQMWAFEIQAGLTPWSRTYVDGNRSDAFLMGTIDLFPENWYEFRLGMFSGWEFLTSSDNWTMKVMGVTAGPNINWKFIHTFIGYNFGKLSTLVEPDRWVHGGIISMSFNFKISTW